MKPAGQSSKRPRHTEPEEAKNHRNRVLSVRLTRGERRRLRRYARACGMPLSTYLREVGLGRKPRPRPNRLERKAIYHLARIGNNLNQLAHLANSLGKVKLSRRLEHVIEQVLRAMAKLS